MKRMWPSNRGIHRLLTLSVLTVLCALQLVAQPVGRGAKPIQSTTKDDKEIPLYNESHALVIGVSAYQNGWRNLPGVTADIDAVRAALTEHGFRVTVVENPTGVALDQALKTFVGTHGQAAKNRLLIYFAGHGHTLRTGDQRTLGYLVPSDAPLPEKGAGAFKQAALSLDTIEVYAKQIESLHALFVFDSCFSGTLFETMRSTPATILDKLTKPVRMFLTAGTAEQEVPDKSIFRAEFIRGINGAADLNQDGYVTGSELGVHVEDKVTNYTHKAQTPRWGKIRHPELDKGDFVFFSDKTRREAASKQKTKFWLAPILKPYSQMTEAEQLVFIQETEMELAARLGADATSASEDALRMIKRQVDAYAARANSLSETPGEEGLRAVFGRASQYAPIVNQAFQEQKVSPLIGLYIPMVESEYRACLENASGGKGLLSLLGQTAQAYELRAEDRCDVKKNAPVAAKFLAARKAELGSDFLSIVLVIASFDSRSRALVPDWQSLRRGAVNVDDWLRKSATNNYMPKFFAAAIVGENPQVFGLPIQPLSTH